MTLRLSTQEYRAVYSLAFIYACRMLGLFMILPVFSLYTHTLAGATPWLMGVTMGIYGLTQAGLQIPLGILSDRIGRKPVIAGGLLLFATGSVIAAYSDSVYGIMIGRAIQGAGAVSSATMALIADVTRPEHRTKAMALIGMIIGISFAVALILGPVIHQWGGIYGIFMTSAALCILAIFFLLWGVPNVTTAHPSDLNQLPNIWNNSTLWILGIGVFIQHAVFTGTFLVMPILLSQAGLLASDQWKFYLPIVVVAFLACLPLIIVAEAKRKIHLVTYLCIIGLTISEALYVLFHAHLWLIASALVMFFTAFTTLEAIMPSLTSKLAPSHAKGAAMGMYSTAQFTGIFVGGMLAGFVYQHSNILTTLMIQVLFLLIWATISRHFSLIAKGG